MVDTVLLTETFDGPSLDTGSWTANGTTISVSGGALSISSNLTPAYVKDALAPRSDSDVVIGLTKSPYNHGVQIVGLNSTAVSNTGLSAALDGVSIRWSTTGNGILNINGVAQAETVAPALSTTYRFFRIRYEGGVLKTRSWTTTEGATWDYTVDLTGRGAAVTQTGNLMISANRSSSGTSVPLLVSGVTLAAVAANASVEVITATQTMSLQAQDATVVLPISATVDLSTVTTSVAAYDAAVEVIQTAVISPTEDFSVTSGGVITDNNVVRADGSPLEAGIFKFDIPQGVSITKVVFKYNTVGKSISDSLQPDVYLGVVETWNTTNYYNTAVTGEVAVPTANGAKSTDITSLVNPATFKGLKFYRKTGASSMDLGSKENSTSANRPTLEVSYVPSPNATVDLDTPSMGLQAQDTITTAQRSTEILLDTQTLIVSAQDASTSEGAGIVADTAVASLAAYEATADTVTSPDVTIELATAGLFAQAPEPNAGAGTTVDASDTDTVMLGAYDPTVELTMSTINDVDTPTIGLTHIRVTDVNGEPVLPTESEDRYYNATMNTLMGVQEGYSGGLNGTENDTAIEPYRQIWFRMNETSGLKAYDRLYRNDLGRAELDLSNVVVGLNSGPEGRSHFYFNGDAYAAEVGGKDGAGEPESGLEFTFRTTKKNQYLMGNADAGGRLFQTAPLIWELWMVDGRLEIRTGRIGLEYGTRNPTVTWSVHGAFTDLADGDWHHVVLQAGYHSWINRASAGSGWGLELFVDSRLEMRRREPAVATYGFPDFIGGRPSPFYPDQPYGVSAPELLRSQWFVGDLTEVVWRQGRALSDDEVARQRDTMFGIFPYYGEGAKLSVQTQDATVKGNKPRILVLNFDAGRNIENRKVAFTVEPQVAVTAGLSPTLAPWGQVTQARIAFPGLGESLTNYDMANKNKWPEKDYLKFEHHVTYYGNLKNYRDAVTDNNRLIDLNLDLNMEDFDIISVVGFPGNETQMFTYDAFDGTNAQPFIPGRKMLENLLAQVRDQVVNKGKSLFIADPFSAIAMGIVDQVDVVPEFYEIAPRNLIDIRLGAINPGFDGHAFATDPFGGATPVTKAGPGGIPTVDYAAYAKRPDKLRQAARYEDTHGNVKQRVRAVIDGLTTVGGYVQTDEIQWWNVNPFNEPPYNLSRAYADKRAGLGVGDEFYIDAPKWSEIYYRDSFATQANWKHDGYRVAAPMSAVKVGTVVTSFSPFFYAGTEEAAGAFEGPLESDAIGNPYQNHAISIAIQPGDSWNGQTVQGKVYVNFTESMQFLAEQKNMEKILSWEQTDGTGLSIGQEFRFRDGTGFRLTPEMAKYQWSLAYGTTTGSEVNVPNMGSGPDWGWSAGGTRGTGISGGTAEALNWSWTPAAKEIPIYVPTMSERALKWLATDLDLDGSASVATESATITTKANEVVVEVTGNAVVELATARISTESHNDLDTIDPDVTVLVTTPSTLLRASGTNADIDVATATVSLVSSDPTTTDDVIDWSETIVLRLPRQIITLIMEDN